MAGNSGYGGSTLSVTGGAGGRRSPSFASETQRFPSQQAAEGSEICLLEADRKKWTTSGQPLTTRTARETLPELKANEWVPPPRVHQPTQLGDAAEAEQPAAIAVAVVQDSVARHAACGRAPLGAPPP